MTGTGPLISPGPNKGPMTNADRIRAMSDKELARQIAEFTGYRANPEEVAFWLDWLQGPSEGGGSDAV